MKHSFIRHIYSWTTGGLSIVSTAFLALALLVSGCESDSEIVLSPRSHVIVSALAYKDSSLVVYVYGSTNYADTADYAPVANADIDVDINGNHCAYARISNGLLSADFGDVGLSDGDSLEVTITGVLDNDDYYHVSSVMLEPVPIIQVDTFTVLSDGRQQLEMAVVFDDPPLTDDYYQVEVRLLDNEKIVPLTCNFSDYYFYLASASLSPFGTRDNTLGLLTDEFLSGRYNLSFSVLWDDIRAAIDGKSYQGQKNVQLEIILYRHTYDYYSFMRTAHIAQNYMILPVFGIPSIYSNVSNGEGIISCMSLSSASLALTFNDNYEKN